MRPKSKNIFPEFFDDETETEKRNKNARHFRDLYKSFDDPLQKYPEIEQLATSDSNRSARSIRPEAERLILQHRIPRKQHGGPLSL